MKKLLFLSLFITGTSYANWRVHSIANNSGNDVLIATRNMGYAPGLVRPSGEAYYLGANAGRHFNKILSTQQGIVVGTQAGLFRMLGKPGITYNIQINQHGIVRFEMIVPQANQPMPQRLATPSTSPEPEEDDWDQGASPLGPQDAHTPMQRSTSPTQSVTPE